MDTTDAKATLTQNVRDVLGEIQAGRVDAEATMAYLMEIIEASDPARYEHSITLRAHDYRAPTAESNARHSEACGQNFETDARPKGAGVNLNACRRQNKQRTTVMPFESPTRRGRTATVLIHGLGETPMILAPVALALGQQGHTVESVAYPSTLKPTQVLGDEYIVPALSRFNDFDRLNFVTHSLGGVLLHYALQRHRPANLARVVMTGPGLHGSEALEVYRRSFAFRMLYGPAAYQSGTGSDAFTNDLPKSANYELGIISGCLSSDLLANTFIPWPHDGKISVPRTRIEGMKDHIVLPLSHDFFSNDPLAVYEIVTFLKDGRFFHLADTPPVASITVDISDEEFANTAEFIPDSTTV